MSEDLDLRLVRGCAYIFEQIGDTRRILGSAYLTGKTSVVTSEHVVRGRTEVSLVFEISREERRATVKGTDEATDCAILELDRPLEGVDPLQLVIEAPFDERWVAWGYPKSATVTDKPIGYMLGGTIRTTVGTDVEGEPAIQLLCDETSSGMSVKGISGGPVVLRSASQGVRVIGHIKSEIPGADGNTKGATLYACASRHVLALYARLGLALPAAYGLGSADMPTSAYNATGASALTSALDPSFVSRVLFDIYKDDSEPYYVPRQDDQIVAGTAAFSGAWVFGPSGCGKSSAIRRYLIQQMQKWHHIGLALCDGLSNEAIFASIRLELEDCLGQIISPNIDALPVQASIRRMIEILSSGAVASKTVFHVDEIPIDRHADMDQFVRTFTGFVLSYATRHPSSEHRWMLSSIHSPVAHLPKTQQQIIERLRFVEFAAWLPVDLERLIAVTTTALQFQLTVKQRDALILSAAGSPRFVKAILRKLVSATLWNDELLKRLIQETAIELR